jgi:YjjG family noncanonical pyrimidine nucleotidase
VRYTTVLLDLDHTLLDSDASLAAAFDATMRTVGVDEPRSAFDTFDRINQALWRRVERHELSPNDVKVLRFAQLLDALDLDGDPTAMGATFVDALTLHGELYPGALALLDWLTTRVRLGLVTNGIGSVQRGRIDRLDLGDTFDAIVISGEVGTSKPGPDIFALALEALGEPDRSDCVMVGDNLGSDVQGGINAGIDTIWFNPQQTVPTPGIEPTHTVADLGSVASIVSPFDGGE